MRSILWGYHIELPTVKVAENIQNRNSDALKHASTFPSRLTYRARNGVTYFACHGFFVSMVGQSDRHTNTHACPHACLITFKRFQNKCWVLNWSRPLPCAPSLPQRTHDVQRVERLMAVVYQEDDSNSFAKESIRNYLKVKGKFNLALNFPFRAIQSLIFLRCRMGNIWKCDCVYVFRRDGLQSSPKVQYYFCVKKT